MTGPVVSYHRPGSWLPGRPGSPLLAAAACCVISTASVPAAAQTPFGPDPEIGYDLAARVCSACHLIEPRHAGPVIAGVPSLMQIAETHEDAEIKAAITAASHPAMPSSPLDREERQHLLAYIRSLAEE